MKTTLILNTSKHPNSYMFVLPIFTKSTSGKKTGQKKVPAALDLSHWSKDLKNEFKAINASKHFKGNNGDTLTFTKGKNTYLGFGLGDAKQIDGETFRREISKLYKAIKNKYDDAVLLLDGVLDKTNLNIDEIVYTTSESISLTCYGFEKYKSVEAKSKDVLQHIILSFSKVDKSQQSLAKNALKRADIISSSVNLARDFVFEAPNILDSENFAKEVASDAKKIKGVKVKVLKKEHLKKEKMKLFLSVNAGSSKDPNLVHLSYVPSKVTRNTPHIALVGKGLTFDSGGYSLKPPASQVGMKGDMAGAATVYGAFKAAVLLNPNAKISCFLGMTDNAISKTATFPDSVIKARNGKTVEILNTDAEGRLVLADVLSYACDQKPDVVIDCATLTGAISVALGNQICGLLSNNDKLCENLKVSANNIREYIWRLPIIDEFRDSVKSEIADLKNVGKNRYGGSCTAAAFLENFVSKDVAWAHLDIAGIATDQTHLPYCPSKGASGLMVRTLVHFLTSYEKQ
ncbi:MAG: leucyl aminopeptidase [Bacteriovoracaceae bacterium]|nr:leucyl aminopeptidase [Bacteriovoracaceae bacterium]